MRLLPGHPIWAAILLPMGIGVVAYYVLPKETNDRLGVGGDLFMANLAASVALTIWAYKANK